jgi:hypothetical protein
MPPLVIRLHVETHAGRQMRLWIPLFLLWLLMLPFVAIMLPVLFITCVVLDVDPFPALGAIWSVLCAFTGSHIEVEAPDASVFFHVL